MALTAVACLTACDDSSSGASNSIPTYKTEAALPDTCEMEVAKAGDTYFACFENKWVEVTDSATVEKIKEGLDEDDLKEELEDMMAKLSSSSKKPSSSSKKVESSDDEGSAEPESSASEEECTGRRCKTGGSSSSKKSSGGNGGSGSGEGGESSSPSSAESSSPSSAETSSPSSAESSSPSSAETSSPSSVSSSSVAKCGDATYNPKTEWCHTTDNTVIAFNNTNCCGTGTKACQLYAMNGNLGIEASSPNFYDITKAFCDTRGTGTAYKKVTIGTQTWMAENLKYETADAVYFNENDDGDYTDRGYFYRFDDVEGSDVCPTGWHVPSASEWKTAITAVIGTGKDPTDFLIAASITYDGYAYGSSTTYWFDATHGSSGNDDAVSFWMSDGKAAYFENSGKTYDIGGTSVYDNDRSLVRCVTD